MRPSSGAARELALRVVVPGFSGTTTPDWLARRIERRLAGVCWFGQNLAGAGQAATLAAELHAIRPDLLVLCDEEGGDVSRLAQAGAESWPGHGALGHLDDTAATTQVARAIGHQARTAGIDVAVSPVADVNSDPRNPVIGVRSFGSSTDLVSRHVAAFVGGLQSAGVAACAKHFPGHGATRVDSHLGLPVVGDPLPVVRDRDLPPFAAAVAAGVRSVMTAHVVFRDIDEQPATLSPPVLDLLRNDLGFDGVVISDALDMHAISRGVGRGPGAALALASGVDLLCIGNPGFPEHYDAEAVLDEVVGTVADAISDGTIDSGRIEQAVDRVQDLAAWVRASRDRAPHSDPDRTGSSEIAARAVGSYGAVQQVRDPLVVTVAGPTDVAAGGPSSVFVDEITRRCAGAEAVAVSRPEDVHGLGDRARGRSVVVVVGPRADAGTDATVRAALAALPEAVLLDAGPAGRSYDADRAVRTFGGGRAMAVAAVDLLLEGGSP